MLLGSPLIMGFIQSAFLNNEASKLEKWLARIRTGKPLAVILGSSSVHGLSFSRSLGRRGVPVLVLDSEKDVARYSRYGRSCMLSPTKECASEWVFFLEFVGSRLGKPGVIFV